MIIAIATNIIIPIKVVAFQIMSINHNVSIACIYTNRIPFHNEFTVSCKLLNANAIVLAKKTKQIKKEESLLHKLDGAL
jgi:hypothetical protein